MGLQFTDRRLIGSIITDAWQNHLQTEMDPANGQWFTNGPNNNGGLYGALTDALATELVFNADQKTFNRSQIAAATGTADNRNGLTPAQTVTLTYSFQDSSTTTHSSTNSIKVGIAVGFKQSFTIPNVGSSERSISFSTDYTYSWTETTSRTTTETQTFSQAVPVTNIPAGKVYEVVLLADKDSLQIPFRADVYLTGHSSACFASPVNGRSVWSADAGTLCEWIAQFGSAGADSHKYSRDTQDPSRGRISIEGLLTASRTVNFTARTSDITDSYSGAPATQATLSHVSTGQVQTQGRMVAEKHLAG